jgi:hypothetical protein
MFCIDGPSLGYFCRNKNILILGDFHSPVESVPRQHIIKLLEKVSPVDLYIEDHTYVGRTTELEETYKEQKEKVCDKDKCTRITHDKVKINGRRNHSSLKGVNEYLLTCGRHDVICPLEKNNRVFRVDIRAQTLFKKSDGTILQIEDDRFLKVNENNFINLLLLFQNDYSRQALQIQTGLEKKFISSLIYHIKNLDSVSKRQVFDWWTMRVSDAYPPWINNQKYIFSTEYNRSWTNNTSNRTQLLNLIFGNALMDLSILCLLHVNGAFTDEERRKIFYMGCAHAEVVKEYMKDVMELSFEEAIENEFRLHPVKKTIHFTTSLSEFFRLNV